MANQITLILLPIFVICLAIVIHVRIRKARNTRGPQIHAPSSPNVGYDAKEMVRSRGSGMADGGM